MMKSNSKKTWHLRIFTLLLFFGSLVFSLILVEFMIRYFYPQRMYYNMSRWDPYVGFSYIPNIKGFSKTKDYEMFVKINSHGLRDREFDYKKPSNTIRIGVFGDSFTFGEGVQNNETYPKRLEHLLIHDEKMKDSPFRIEVLNFGIGKTGTSHQLAWYQKEGRKYHLDYVILGFLSGNDFGNNWGGVFYLKEDKLVHNPTAYSSIRKIQNIVYHIPFYKWLANHSHLVNLLRKTVTIFHDRRQLQKGKSFNELNKENAKALDSKKIYLTLRLIEEFRKEVLEDNSRFLVVHLPAKGQRSLSTYTKQEQISYFIILWDTLSKNLREKNIEVLDLVPFFSTLPETQVYFKDDGHMTKYGNQAVASHIYKTISPRVLR